jgi:exodeoxyribonuclease V gamma subunit
MIDHALDAWQLVGRVGDRRSDGGLLQVQAGVPRARQLVGFWIRHLALHVVSGRGVTSTLVGMPDSKGAGGAYELGPVSDADAQLRVLLGLFDRGHDAPLPFFPETSRAYANALRPDLEGEASARESALRDAQKKFLPSFGGAPAESEDAYVQRVFRDASVLGDPAFASTALAVWRPIAGRLGVAR